MVSYEFLDYHFSVFQNYGSSTRVTRLKVALNMADPTSMKHSVSNLKECQEIKTVVVRSSNFFPDKVC